MRKKFKDFIFLYQYFKHKKENFVRDIEFKYWGTISERDILDYKILVQLNNGDIVNINLVAVDFPGTITSEGLGFDIEYKDGCKAIRECSFFEFYRDYRELILYIIDNEEVVKTWAEHSTLTPVPSF